MHTPKWLAEAQRCIGIKEGPGAANNPAVVKMYAEAGHSGIKHDSVAWCAAFVGAMLKRAGLKPNGSLAARSYESYGQRLAEPLYGCIGVKKRSGKNAPAWQGHVGFVVAANRTTVWLLGGNQGDAVKVAPFDRSEFTAFRWPSGQPLGSTAPLSNAARGATSEA